jgi:exodeoxyribonuclease X
MRPHKIIVVDTETTGQDEPVKVCEVAWQELDENLDTIDSVHSLIDPERPIKFGATAIHGIHNHEVVNAPTLDEFFYQVKGDPFKDCDVTFIAHNAKYDLPLLAPYMPSVANVVCTLRLARRFLPDAEDHKLATLRVQYQLGQGVSHSADGDVLTCLRLVRLIVAKEQRPLLTLAAEANKPMMLDKVPFGKHKGVPFMELDKGWAAWALKNLKDLDVDMKFSLEQRLK